MDHEKEILISAILGAGTHFIIFLGGEGYTKLFELSLNLKRGLLKDVVVWFMNRLNQKPLNCGDCFSMWMSIIMSVITLNPAYFLIYLFYRLTL